MRITVVLVLALLAAVVAVAQVAQEATPAVVPVARVVQERPYQRHLVPTPWPVVAVVGRAVQVEPVVAAPPSRALQLLQALATSAEQTPAVVVEEVLRVEQVSSTFSTTSRAL
jgi:hypothetical protein